MRFAWYFTAAGFVAACQPAAGPPPAAPLRIPSPAVMPLPQLAPTVSPVIRTSPPPVRGVMPAYPYALPATVSAEPLEAAGMVLEQGKPAVGLPLSVIGTRTSRTWKVKTDSQGIFRVANLPEGDYYVHYYNDSDNNKVGFWRSRNLPVSARFGAVFPTWDDFLVGMRNRPGQGAAVAFPFTAEFEPYPLAITYRFRIHDRGGPGGSALYVSDPVPAKGVRSFTFPGAFNQNPGGGAIGSGRYLWGYQWDSGALGEGGCLFQDFVSSGVRAEAPTPLERSARRTDPPTPSLEVPGRMLPATPSSGPASRDRLPR